MTITIDKKTIKTPDAWNELTLKQALYCYAILMTDLNTQFKPMQVLPAKRITIMLHLLEFKKEEINDWKPEQIYQVSHAVTNFLFEEVQADPEEPIQHTIALKLTKNPYPYFQYKNKKGKKIKYYAPADALSNLSIYELGTAFTIFEAYLKTQEELLVDKLIAILYRPHKPKTKLNKSKAYEGDRRLPYLNYEATVPARQKRIRKLPPLVKAITLFWFASCRQAIVNSYPNIFVAPEKQDKSTSQNDYGWGGVLMGLADGVVHLDAVSKQNYKNAFARLSYLEDQRKLAELRLKR